MKHVTGLGEKYKSSPAVEGWLRDAQLSTSGTTLVEPAQCLIVKSNSAIERHHLASLNCWGGGGEAGE